MSIQSVPKRFFFFLTKFSGRELIALHCNCQMRQISRRFSFYSVIFVETRTVKTTKSAKTLLLAAPAVTSNTFLQTKQLNTFKNETFELIYLPLRGSVGLKLSATPAVEEARARKADIWRLEIGTGVWKKTKKK